MKNKYISVILISISFLFFQCHKDISYVGDRDHGVSETPDPITANIQGNIVDENNEPAAGVVITAGTSTTVTNTQGFFHIIKASLDKNTSLITAQKDGYFKAYRVFAATSGCNQVAIKLIKKDVAGTVSASTGGEVSLPDGSKINLPANGIVNASSGSDYTGDVKVYASYINPKAHDITRKIPGSFVANDKNGKRVVLSSYGMLAVNLESASGEKLQLKEGYTATITIPVHSSGATAPRSISLWYLDEKNGIWQEEGMATKNGNVYTGSVKHFSFWNCDFPNDAVNLSFTLQTPDNSPLVNAYVEVISEDSAAGMAYGYTDSLGQIRGLVPANKNLVMKVFSMCDGEVFSKNIQGSNQNFDLGTITIPASTSSLLTFTGTVLDCDASAVTKGYVLINFDGTTRYVAADANGKFVSTYLVCSNISKTATIQGVDETGLQQGTPTSLNINFPVTNAGNISACGTSVEEFINFTIDSTNYSTSFGDPRDTVIAFTYPDSLLNHQTFISYGFYNVNNRMVFAVDSTYGVGTYPITQLYPALYNPITIIRPFDVTFTSFPSTIGQFYEGHFSGQFADGSSIVHTINCTFKVKKDF